ncbi:GNAT family N-acetyltransferase [Frigidibacter sp. ROC022]|uniref:GNAT family N-acetyltransferase n=1 Tax=Frigidibacter sp. ROC022 TaxID=2971796 RepID=UPI00215A6158|nr:GNAT family N-acetyltransferase [Frigidibacter sp. ROC022]MCR8726409.1 GNAT family N-acetyltransferase [Frigidibacter sp. ROC022]
MTETAASGSVTLRPIEARDRRDWGRLWTDYLAFYDTSLPVSIHDTTFARLTGDDPALHGLIAEVDGRPSGLVHYIFHEHCWTPEGVTYLQDLYADPEQRGIGLGRALIEAVYAAADAAGRPSVYWLTQDFNATARRLYDRVGRLSPFIKYTRPA